MASFMSSTFTTGEKRKKVTYGRLSRLPPPRRSFDEEDAPSPERPHKHTALSSEAPAGSGVFKKSAHPPETARAATTSPDVFDVPSEDEFGFPSTPPAKRPVVQRSKTDGISRAISVKKVAPVPDRPTAPASRPPRKSAVAKPTEVKAKVLQGQTRPQQVAQEKETQARIQSAHTKSKVKTLQGTKDQGNVVTGEPRAQPSNTFSKDISRATTSNQVPQLTSKPQATRAPPTTVLKKAAKPAAKLPVSLDLFDVPSGDEIASLPVPVAHRQTPRPLSKTMVKQPISQKVPSLDMTRKLSEVGSLQNRKRKGSVSLATVSAPTIGSKQDMARIQRDRKIPKRRAGTSPHLESTNVSIAGPEPQTAAPESVIDKPKRTRTRTVPVIRQPKMMKGQSSPAVLREMLPIEQATKPSHKDTPEVLPSDDTMYDIPDSVMTPVRPTSLGRTKNSTPGSVTPRQKDLFSTLLGSTAPPKTPASALAALQLTDKKPRSLLGALARSKSDVAYSSQSRKTRLIDTLKDDHTSSDDEEGESDEDADSTIVTSHGDDHEKTPVQTRRILVEETSGDVTMNEKIAGDSQTSQLSSAAATRPRLTYAAQRSYLQEANPEDEFLMSMDMDDSWKTDSQTVSTDDEDAPTSQPRNHHELKKYGQNTMFSWDMEESIREISVDAKRSGRRSAMMDLCVKMADAGFVSQLLDSGFMHKLLENLGTPTDTIFDFIAAASVLFILQTKPTFSVVDQIHKSGVVTTLMSLLDGDVDISRVARDRKSSMSKIAQESLAEFRMLVCAAKAWSSSTLEQISPRLVALKTIDLLIQSLRESGSTEALFTPTDIAKIVSVCPSPSTYNKATRSSSQDSLVLDLAISILETVSITDQDSSTWPTRVLQHLAEVITIFFEDEGLTRTVEAMKLCMNLTNNKPKACQPFSNRAFVQPLVQSLVSAFELLNSGDLGEKHQAALTLSLGAMINLAELSDEARVNAVVDTDCLEALVKTYIVGSERAARATSFEESEVGVKANFLGVLLGMLCLNAAARSKIQALLPSQQLSLLLQNMRVFARIHETVDEKTASRFEGPEGQEALNNYYVRIMLVVQKLESAKA